MASTQVPDLRYLPKNTARAKVATECTAMAQPSLLYAWTDPGTGRPCYGSHSPNKILMVLYNSSMALV